MSLSKDKIKELYHAAYTIRLLMMRSLSKTGGSGHSAGGLGMADIFSVLFFHVLKHNPVNPSDPERDLFVLSNGHICPVYYATLAQAKYFDIEELDTLRHFGSPLQGHPHRDFLPLLETSSGPLGSGLSQALGMALGLRLDKREDRFVYVFLSDGELEEGNTWEAVMAAGKEKPKNLIAVVDRNRIQIDGNTENVMPLESLEEKFTAFNWHVEVVDGNDVNQVVESMEKAKKYTGKPSVILANTIPGKGVSYMEGDYRWHGVPPGSGPEDQVSKDMQVQVALEDLRSHLNKYV